MTRSTLGRRQVPERLLHQRGPEFIKGHPIRPRATDKSHVVGPHAGLIVEAVDAVLISLLNGSTLCHRKVKSIDPAAHRVVRQLRKESTPGGESARWQSVNINRVRGCLLYTSDAADE